MKTKKTAPEPSCYEMEGIAARRNGESKDDCPYGMSKALTAADLPFHIKARADWMRGFAYYDEDVKSEAQKGGAA
jgi:hypothetical protein